MTAIPGPVAAVQQLFAAYPGQWWIAGGWALDLFARQVRRPHTDVDVQIRARDHQVLAAAFRNLDPVVLHRPTGDQRPLGSGSAPEPGPDSIRLTGYPDLEILPARTDGDGPDEEWVYHRGNGRIRMPLSRMGTTGLGGVPIVCPEVVLMFAARNHRPKDESDFRDVLPALSARQQLWLLDGLPPGHAWRQDIQRSHDTSHS